MTFARAGNEELTLMQTRLACSSRLSGPTLLRFGRFPRRFHKIFVERAGSNVRIQPGPSRSQ